MGDRANVQFVYEKRDFEEAKKVYFYTHWSGYELPQKVAAALDRGRDRWDDESYLARIVFSEMIRDEINDTTGYGIAPYRNDYNHADVVIDMNSRTVNGVSFEEFIKNPFEAKDGG